MTGGVSTVDKKKEDLFMSINITDEAIMIYNYPNTKEWLFEFQKLMKKFAYHKQSDQNNVTINQYCINIFNYRRDLVGQEMIAELIVLMHKK